MWFRWSIRRKRRSPIPDASSFSNRRVSGSVTAGRAETWRADYLEKLNAHRAAMREEAQRVRASFIIHRTDRPASELVLALHARMGEGGDAPVVAASRTAQAEAGA